MGKGKRDGEYKEPVVLSRLFVCEYSADNQQDKKKKTPRGITKSNN